MKGFPIGSVCRESRCGIQFFCEYKLSHKNFVTNFRKHSSFKIYFLTSHFHAKYCYYTVDSIINIIIIMNTVKTWSIYLG